MNYKEMTDEQFEQGWQVILKAKGDRSLRAYASDAGINFSLLSKYKSKLKAPQFETILKLTSESAKPQNGVTKFEMLSAYGYLREIGSELDDKAAGEKGKPASDYRKNITINQKSNEDNIAIKNRIKEHIATALSDNNISFKLLRDEVNKQNIGQYEPRLSYQINNVSDLNQWIVKIMFCADSPWEDEKDRFSNIIFLRKDLNRKVTFIYDNKEIYDKFTKCKNLSFNGELSIAYYDREQDAIIEEINLTTNQGKGRKGHVYLGK